MDDAVILPYSVHLADLEKVLRRNGVDVLLRDEPPAQETATIASKKSNAGRHQTFDHAALIDDLFEYMTHENHGKMTETEAVEWAQKWTEKHSDRKGTPTRSTLQPIIRKAFEKYDAWVARHHSDGTAGN